MQHGQNVYITEFRIGMNDSSRTRTEITRDVGSPCLVYLYILVYKKLFSKTQTVVSSL